MKKNKFSELPLFRVAPFLLKFIGMGIAMWATFWGSEITKPWGSLSILKEHSLTKTITEIPGIQVILSEPVYYVQQIWLPNPVTIPIWVWEIGGVLLWLIWFGIAYGLLTKGKTYFGIWIGFLALSFFCFRWEVIWESTNGYVYFWMVLLTGLVSHGLVHGWLPVGKRVGMAIIGFLLFSIALYGAKSANPFATMWAYGSLWLFGVGLWFVAWSAPTLVAAMYYLVFQNSEKGRSNWKTLVFITILYCINLLWMYALEVKWIEESTMWIKPFHLWMISSFSGWWFWKQKEKQTSQSYLSNILWVSGFLSVIILFSWTQLAWLDAWLDVINEWITISYFWMAIAYLIYLALNFFEPIQAGVNITKLWHQPRRIPWLLPQMGGLVACFVTLSFKNGYTVDQAIAGSFYQQADYYQRVGQEDVAETLYRQGLVYDPFGWKGNYSLGMLARKHQDHALAATYFQRVIQKNMEPAALVALAQSLEAENLFFDGIFTLQKVKDKNPDSRVFTQLAYLFDRANVQDSAAFYREKAFQLAPEQSVEKTNHLIQWIEQNTMPTDGPSKRASIGEKANWTALAKIHVKPWVFEPDTSRPVGVDRFAWVFNQVTSKQADYWDPTYWETGLPGWELFQRELLYAQAIQSYNQGSKKEAFDLMKSRITVSSDSIPDLFLFQYGAWLAEQGAWHAFKENILPRLKPEQRNQVVVGQVWKDRQEKQWEMWKKESWDAEKTWNQFPYNERIILNQVEILIKEKGKENAYRFLVNVLDTYDVPISWWEKYVELANDLGLRTYAEDGKNEIRIRRSRGE